MPSHVRVMGPVGEDRRLVPASELAQKLLDLGHGLEEEASGFVRLRALADEQRALSTVEGNGTQRGS